MERPSLQESVRLALEFYKELGFERLPFSIRSAAPAERKAAKREPRTEQLPSAPHRTITDESRRPAAAPVTRDAPRDRVELLRLLREEIGDCERCKLSKGRTTLVFGEGDPGARVMFIGEAPGQEEDRRGRPFVGDAGQLLTRLIEKMGFAREEVYIANIVKCRPPMNRDPQDDEMQTCFPFLDRQIEIVAPRVIVSLGKIAAHTLMGLTTPITKFSITRSRGKFFDYRGIPVMPTFHPAYLLRNPKDKWLTWEDAQAVLKRLGEEAGDV